MTAPFVVLRTPPPPLVVYLFLATRGLFHFGKWHLGPIRLRFTGFSFVATIVVTVVGTVVLVGRIGLVSSTCIGGVVASAAIIGISICPALELYQFRFKCHNSFLFCCRGFPCSIINPCLVLLQCHLHELLRGDDFSFVKCIFFSFDVSDEWLVVHRLIRVEEVCQ